MAEKIKNKIGNRKNIFRFLTAGVVISLAFYVFFLSHTVHTVFLRQQTERALSRLQNNIGDLETRYLSLKTKITPEMARASGFKNIASSIRFVSRNPLGKALSLNNEI